MEKQVFLGEAVVTYRKSPTQQVVKVTGSSSAYDVLRKQIGDLFHHQEAFMVMYLNRAHNIMWAETIAVGTEVGVQVPIQQIIKRATVGGAQAIIVGHNHPSNQQLPSANDKRWTKKLANACKVLDISLLDHIIVCDDAYYSFSDEGSSYLQADSALN